MNSHHMPATFALVLISLLLSMARGNDTTGTSDWMPDLARIRPEAGNGIQNSGWAYDRYRDLPTLDAGREIVLADIKGPAVIKQIHILRPNPFDVMTRGVVLKIYFENETEPAVLSSLGDFFCLGNNGRSRFFSSLLTEYAPQTQNAYFPMPFRSHAKVCVKNETTTNTAFYAFVEWESLPRWDPELGYFHATFQRKCFQLSPQTNETFFEVQGKGHLVGRQFSFASDEPLIGLGGTYWGEANNEVDIDGVERAVEYLGFEDSFNLSWGWCDYFSGLRNSTTNWEEVDKPKPIRLLSFFRFHDHKPIRFNKSLRWRINLTNDAPNFGHEFTDRIREGGFWVDFATVHYWYQDSPAGYRHELPPLAVRTADLLRSSLSDYSGKPRMIVQGRTRPSELLIPGGRDYDEWFASQMKPHGTEQDPSSASSH